MNLWRYLRIAKILAIVVLVFSFSIILVPDAIGQGNGNGEDGIVVKVVAEEEPLQLPANWVLVRDETHTDYDSRGQPVEIRVREYRGPLTPVKEGQCGQSGEGETNGLRAWYCDYWYPGSIHSTAQVGGVTQHLYTSFTRYHWTGSGGGSAWYLNYSKVWWTRSSTAWSTGQTHMWIANTAGSKDCQGNSKTYGDYNDWFTPSWYSSTQTYTYYYYTSGRGILVSPHIHPRIHQIGPTPVKLNGSSYGTLPEVRHRFWQYGYGN
jgi:hypothetical protein